MRELIFQRPDGFDTDAKHDAYCVGELIRCKDCSKRKKNKFCLEHLRYEEDDGYCSYGERSE